MPIDPKVFFDDSNFTGTMKSRRQRLELTHEQLSRLTKRIDPAGAGVSRVALSRYETGASLPGLRELRLIALSLRVPLAQLVYGENTDPMLPYRLSLEMRITEMVAGSVLADGIIKDSQDQEPESGEYAALLAGVKQEG